MSRRAIAITMAGIVLSHPEMVTRASNMCPRATSSTESAMRSRLTSEVFMPSVPIVIPSVIAIVLYSMGVPPASRMPCFTLAASSRWLKLQGMVSIHEWATPTWGRARSSSVKPIAFIIARAPARSGPSRSTRLLCRTSKGMVLVSGGKTGILHRIGQDVYPGREYPTPHERRRLLLQPSRGAHRRDPRADPLDAHRPLADRSERLHEGRGQTRRSAFRHPRRRALREHPPPRARPRLRGSPGRRARGRDPPLAARRARLLRLPPDLAREPRRGRRRAHRDRPHRAPLGPSCPVT